MNMNILFEEKLSVEERNSLDDKDFGLQYERKYPLNDKKHVISAIQYFRFCKPSQRMELAKNINKKLKYFDMKVNISTENPFYKYIDTKFIATEGMQAFVIMFEEKNYQKMIEEIMSFNPSSYEEFIKHEKCFIKYYNNLSITATQDIMLKFVNICNRYFENVYTEYINYRIYNGEEDKNTIIFGVCEDLITLCTRAYINKNNNYDEFNKYLTTLSKIGYFQPFNFIINRQLLYITLSNQSDLTDEEMMRKFIVIENTRKNLLKNTLNSNEYRLNDLFVNVINEYKYLPMTESYLEITRNSVEKEIYIINRNMNNSSNRFAIPYSEISNIEQKEMIERLENVNINSELIMGHFQTYTTNLSDIDILYLFKNTNIKNVSMGHFKNEICWYGVEHEKVFYILKSTFNDNYAFVEIDDKVMFYLINDEDIDTEYVDNHTRYIPINFKMNTVNEAVSINKDGDIKITIDKKKSYMDIYSEIHRTLHMEYKSGNVEGMKTNVSLMFALINSIEHDKKYKERDTDLIKARAFAMNDFKTYLKHIYESEPDFVFIDYYRNTDLGKKVFNISSETITGIKKLFKTIVLA